MTWIRNRSMLLLLGAVLAAATACERPRTAALAPSAVAVTTERTLRGEHVPVLTVLGTVRPAQTVPLVASRGGRLSFPARFAAGLRTGERVEAGELLASIENEEARANLERSRLSRAAAAVESERAAKAVEQGVMATREQDNVDRDLRLRTADLESARRQAAPLQLVAQGAGTLVVAETRPPGTLLSGGEKLAELALDGGLRVEALAGAGDRARLTPGLVTRFRRSRRDALKGEGRIAEVASVVDQGGTLRVTVDVIDGAGLPLPGEGVEVQVELPASSIAVTVPDEAVVVGIGGTSVFIVESDPQSGGMGRARRQKVELGGRGNGRVEVVSGLEEGAIVIVSGANLVGDGTVVAEAKRTGKGAAKGGGR